jgi:hypothetical protein
MEHASAEIAVRMSEARHVCEEERDTVARLVRCMPRDSSRGLKGSGANAAHPAVNVEAPSDGSHVDLKVIEDLLKPRCWERGAAGLKLYTPSSAKRWLREPYGLLRERPGVGDLYVASRAVQSRAPLGRDVPQNGLEIRVPRRARGLEVEPDLWTGGEDDRAIERRVPWGSRRKADPPE